MGILSGLMKRSLENPSTPLSAPDDWLFDSLGSFRASSGVNVNRETALTQDTYWRCVALISGDVAKMPLIEYERIGEKKRQAEQEPAFRLMADAWCDEITALAGKRVLTLHALTEGNGYAYIQRNGAGEPIELWPLSPMKTYPVREDSRLWYVTEVGREPRRIRAEDVFHLMGLSFDGLVGYGAVAKMRECLGMAIAAENFGSIFFRNNARPNVVLKHPGRLKPEAKVALRESWERIHSGLENAHRTAVLEEGMDIATFMHNARDSQLLELKQFSRVQICNFFGVPAHKAGGQVATSYSSLEQENEGYLEDGGGLGWWLPAWAAECWRKLLTEQQKRERSHFFKFRTNQLLRANLQARTQYYNTMVTAGILCPDECREEEGYDPRPDGLGGKFLKPANMSFADEPPPAPAPGPGQPPAPADQGKGKQKKDKKRWQPPPALLGAQDELITQTALRMIRRIGLHAQRAAKRPAEFIAWLDTLVPEHGETFRAALNPVIAAADALFDGAAIVGGAQAVATADRLLDQLRSDLLNAAGVLTAKDLECGIASLCERWESEIPSQLAGQLLRKKPTKPTRDPDTALDILARLPDLPGDEKGRVAIPLPVDEKPPFDWKKLDLKGASKRKVWIRDLIATRAEVQRDRLKKDIKDRDNAAGSKSDVGDAPNDRPYVVKCDGLKYLFDGHHRTFADILLGVGKSKVYYLKV